MDRRQRKTRTAIFEAFTALLAEKSFSRITVGEIIARADIGRATFYAHFETKDDLLKALCSELFDHILASAAGEKGKNHLFTCDAPASVFLHLMQHLQKNDNHILDLLSGGNDELFAGYFKEALLDLVKDQQALFAARKDPALPESFWIDHIAAVFTQTVRWWVVSGKKESPEEICRYFYLSV